LPRRQRKRRRASPDVQLNQNERDDPRAFLVLAAPAKPQLSKMAFSKTFCGERLAQIGDAPGVRRLIARGVVLVPGHEDHGALRSLRPRVGAAARSPKFPPRWMSKQQAGCRLRAAACRATPRRRRTSRLFRFRLCANSRAHAPSESPRLSSTTITTICCAAMSVSSPGCGLCPGSAGGPLIWIKENLVRCEQSGLRLSNV